MKILPKIYRALFFLACLSFVSWQSYSLFEKFLKRPRSTSVEIDDTKNWPIPELVFCPDMFDFELEPLRNCDLSKYVSFHMYEKINIFPLFKSEFIHTVKL